jgi:hypothetical protein
VGDALFLLRHPDGLRLAVSGARLPIAPGELVPALLRGYRRSAVAGLPYPVVLRDPTASVNGDVLGTSLKPSVTDLAAMKARTIF